MPSRKTCISPRIASWSRGITPGSATTPTSPRSRRPIPWSRRASAPFRADRQVAWAAFPGSGPSDYLVDLTDPGDPQSVLKSLIVDGEDHTGDWSITDFTLAELKEWLAGTTYDAAKERPKEFNGKFPILSFQEIIDLARAKSQATGRVIAVYPETKNPTWNDEQAIANGCGAPGSHPLEDAVIAIV